jgi:nickel-dependent lactate racemase
MPEKITLPWGKDQVSFELPDSWTVKARLEPESVPPVADPAAEAARSLAEPIGSARLGDRVHPGMKVAVVIDDGSRPTPVHVIYPHVLEELHRGGVVDGDITIVPAIGLHRGMPEEEIRQRLGISPEAPLQFVNPNCDDPATMRQLGITTRGTPVWITSAVANADFVVSIGCIEPHIIASFGGGYKNIIPGVAGRETTAHNHSLNCSPATFNMVGQPIDANPMRQDLEEGSAMLKPPVFIVNAILNNVQQVVQIVAGDPIKAHRSGVAASARLYGVPVPSAADIVITDSHPMDSDLRQGVKALANTVRALKPGGVIITLMRAEEGVGVFGLANMNLPVGRKTIQFLAPLLLPLVPRLKIKGLGEEDRFFLYFALQGMRRGHMYVVAPTIPEETQGHLPFVQFWPTPQAAVEAARKVVPGKAEVVVFPSGGISYPNLQ